MQHATLLLLFQAPDESLNEKTNSDTEIAITRFIQGISELPVKADFKNGLTEINILMRAYHWAAEHGKNETYDIALRCYTQYRIVNSNSLKDLYR